MVDNQKIPIMVHQTIGSLHDLQDIPQLRMIACLAAGDLLESDRVAQEELYLNMLFVLRGFLPCPPDAAARSLSRLSQ